MLSVINNLNPYVVVIFYVYFCKRQQKMECKIIPFYPLFTIVSFVRFYTT